VWNASGVSAEPRLVLVVGAAVLDDLQRPTTLLAARRTEPPGLAGGWEVPGGKVEVGAEVPGPDGDGWPMPPAHRMRVWRVRVVRGVPAPIEDHDALRLLGPGEWLDVAWLPGDVPIVRALLAVSPDAGA
jgi:8-oxo-dGTP diphosphatase